MKIRFLCTSRLQLFFT